jgi:hypothetical protein
MNNTQKAVRIVAYYLSKYDRNALKALNYKSHREAFEKIGEKLGVPANTVKNRRDDYDSVNDNNRNGWNKGELPRSSLAILSIVEELSEDALLEIVKDLLNRKDEEGTLNFLEEENDSNNNQNYNHRGITGKKAEELFKQYYLDDLISYYKEELVDTRDDGCGYDFKLSDESYVFEVKGLALSNGGVSFTDKEWKTAKELRERYILVIVSNVFTSPEIQIITDPYNNINPAKKMTRIVSVNWSFYFKK